MDEWMCIYIHVHVWMSGCVYIYVHVWMSGCVYIYICICMDEWMCVYIYVYEWMSGCVYIYMYMNEWTLNGGMNEHINKIDESINK